MSLAALSKRLSEPDTMALADDRHSLTWRDLDVVINRATNALIHTAFKRERRAAVYARNSHECIVAYLACLHAGVSAVPVSAQLTADELTYILEDSGAELLFAGPETLDVALDASAKVPDIQIVAWRSPSRSTVRDWVAWLAGSSEDTPPDNMPPRTYLQYTSGTTGRPKAIDAVAATLPSAPTVAKFFDEIRAQAVGRAPGPHLVVGPLYHNAPLSSVRGLAAGNPVIVMPRFDPETALQWIERHRIVSSVMVPTHFQRLLALPAEIRARYDVSSLKMVAHTGAACPREVKAAMIEWFGPVLMEAYGGTESGTTNMITSEEWLAHPGSVGRTVDAFELQVIGENAERLGPNQIGQLFFRDKSGRGIIYKNDPEKTRNAHREPGVFTLGEIGYFDDDGYVYITDRVSDMIVSGGVNIYPAEVEQVLLRHPGITDTVVIGVPNADMGEEVKALVMRAPSAPALSADEVIAFCRTHLAAYKCPRTVDFVDDVGRNAIGKVNKRAIRAPYWPSTRTIGG